MVTLPPPVQADGAALDPSQPIPLASTTTLHGGEAAFVRVMDADQNRDPAAVDYLDVRLSTPGGDAETLRIAETGREHRHLRRLHPDPRGRRHHRQLRARGRAQCADRHALRRRSRLDRHQQRQRAGRSLRLDLRFAHRHADQRRARAADRCDLRLACGCCRRRRREQLSVGDAHRLAGHGRRRHGLHAARWRVPLPAGRARQLSAGSRSAGRPCVPVDA